MTTTPESNNMENGQQQPHKGAPSKLVSIESTPDGDIQTVEETTIDANRAFQHHLRDSWDEAIDKSGSNNNGGGSGVAHHKQNLSVQFLDFTISGDGDKKDTATPLTEAQPKDTIEGAAVENSDRTFQNNLRDNRSGDNLKGSLVVHHKRDLSTQLLNISISEDNDKRDKSTSAAGGGEVDDTIDNANRAFQHNLRHSWDEAVSRSEENKGSPSRAAHHRQNLSIQFLEKFSLSEESEVKDASASYASGCQAKESIERARSAPNAIMADTGTASETSPTKSENEDYKSFTKNIRDSWELGEETMEPLNDGCGSGNKKSTSHSRHKQNNLSVQFLDLDEGDYYNGDASDVQTEERRLEAAADAFEPPSSTQTAKLSLDSQPQQQKQQLPLVSKDSSATEGDGIVIPIPLRPANVAGASSARASRKHHRVLSGARPAINHRRLNTRGDKVSPISELDARGYVEDQQQAGGASRKHHRVLSGARPAINHRRLNTRGDKVSPISEHDAKSYVEDQQHEGQTAKKKYSADVHTASPSVMPPPQHSALPLSPTTAAMPPPAMPPFANPPSGNPPSEPPQQPPTHPQYHRQNSPHYPDYRGTPSPSYDPYNPYGSNQYPPPPPAYSNSPQSHPPPPPQQPHYSYGTPPPPHNGMSPRSDTGVNLHYDTSAGGQGRPPPQGAPQQQPHVGNPPQYPYPQANQPQSAPEAGGLPSSDAYSPPGHLAQPSLEEPSPSKSRSKGKIEATSQRRDREDSFNPLPIDTHHRKQSSLGSFLATTGIFDEGDALDVDDADLFYEDEGYVSDPEESLKKKNLHSKTLSSASFMRSLSSDNFLQCLNDDDGKPNAALKILDERDADGTSKAAQGGTNQPQNDLQPLPHQRAPPSPSLPPNGYQRQPSYNGAPPQPPLSSGGYTPPPGYNGYPTTPHSSGPAPPQPQPAPGYSPHPPTPPTSEYYFQAHPTPPTSGYSSQPPTPPGYYQYSPTWPQHAQQPQYQHPPPMQAPPMQAPPHPQHHTQLPPPRGYMPPYPAPPPPNPVAVGSSSPLLGEASVCPPAAEPKGAGRRKCSVPDCPNRVVQGGLCIAHGAVRKKCSHPGCTKNVKKAGLCSAHGPARKRCSVEGCPKVAVQAGRCIAHGAKKKVCCHVHEQGGSQVQCTKQAILGGYCKRHYDEVHGVVKQRKTRAPKNQGEVGNPNHKPGHERGLSLFQDSDLMETIINNGNDGSGGTPELAEEDGLRGAKFVH